MHGSSHVNSFVLKVIGICLAVAVVLWTSAKNCDAYNLSNTQLPMSSWTPLVPSTPAVEWVPVKVVTDVADCYAVFMQDGAPLAAGPSFQEIAISLADTRLYWLFNEHPVCRTAMVVIIESVPKRKHKFETAFAALMSRTAFNRTSTWFPMVNASREATIKCSKCSAGP